MLTKVYDWMRAANPAPTDELVTKRKASITILVDALSEDYALLPDYVIGAVSDVSPNFGQESSLVMTILDAVRAHQPAFPESLAENNLDLRVCCALVVGEIIERARTAKEIPDDHIQLAAALVISGFHSQITISQKYLRDMLLELRSVAFAGNAAAGALARTRYDARHAIDQIKDAGDVPNFWKGALPRFQSAFDTLKDNARKDREEINILWWAFNRTSILAGKPYPQLSTGLAAFCAGLELADMTILPHWPNMPLLASRTITEGRAKEQLSEKPLKDFAAEWTPEVVAKLGSPRAKAIELVRENPSLFPLSWGCLVQTETNTSNWLGDLKKRGNWDAKKAISPDVIALQIYNERIAQRLARCLEE